MVCKVHVYCPVSGYLAPLRPKKSYFRYFCRAYSSQNRLKSVHQENYHNLLKCSHFLVSTVNTFGFSSSFLYTCFTSFLNFACSAVNSNGMLTWVFKGFLRRLFRERMFTSHGEGLYDVTFVFARSSRKIVNFQCKFRSRVQSSPVGNWRASNFTVPKVA